MATNLINQLGDRNPQLLRELRARFQLRSVAVTIGISLLLQAIIFIFFSSQLPESSSSDYCLRGVGVLCKQINWRAWWGDIFKGFTEMIPYLLYIPGVFALVMDISQETQKGTLDFLRLSPRSSQNILSGKLLGVPILGYFSLLLLLPLHLFSAFAGGIPLAFLLSFYTTLLAWAAILFLGATFVGFTTRNNQTNLTGNPQGLMLVIFTASFVIPIIRFWQGLTVWRGFAGIKALKLFAPQRIDWFVLPINMGLILPHLFLFVNLAIVGYWLWWVLQRAFQNPRATLLSKRQSYLIVLYGTLLTVGFCLPENGIGGDGFDQIAFLASSSIYAFLPLIFALSTPRQMLLDWLRHRRENAGDRRTSVSLKEWVLGEKSPGFTAIWINLLIAYGVMSLLLPSTMQDFSRSLVGLFLTVTLVANYSVLVQLILLMGTAKRQVWAVGSLVFAIVVPSIFALLPGFNQFIGYVTPGLWILLGERSNRVTFAQPLGMAIMALMVQALILIVQVGQFRLRLHQMSRQIATPNNE